MTRGETTCKITPDGATETAVAGSLEGEIACNGPNRFVAGRDRVNRGQPRCSTATPTRQRGAARMEFDQLENEAFWRDLVPGLAVQSADGAAHPVLNPSEAMADRMLGILDREGYLQLPRSQDAADMATLASLVEGINGTGLPPVFAFIYDAMWEPYRRLGPIIDCLLRGPHAMMPNIWAWHVDPRKGESGWTPHRDRATGGEPGWPKALTIWIPITEATTLNGCMYVVPKHRDENYGKRSAAGAKCELPDVRAVPAIPGDSLIWTHDLMHWGSRTSALSVAPRMSMSIEFQRLDEPAFAKFIIPSYRILTFDQKLSLIGRAIDSYQHMHHLDGGLAEAARRWRDRIPTAFN